MKTENTQIASDKLIHELFFEMEEDFKLFDLKNENNFPFWDVLRSQIFFELQNPVQQVYSNNSKITKKKIFDKFLNIFKYFFFFLRFLFVKYDDFFFANSRFKDEKGISYDPYLDTVIKQLSDKTIVYETSYLDNSYKYKNIVFDILPLCHKLSLSSVFLLKNTNTKNNIDVVANAVFEKFEFTINKVIFERMYRDFLFDYYFFKLIINFKDIKRIFVLQNGIQKGLFFAAQKLNIPTFEFQHGDIVDSTVVYNYKNLYPDIKRNIVYPQFLLTFSNLWVKNKNIPSNCIEIGTDFLYVQKKKLNMEKTITIISSLFHNEDLKRIAIDLAEQNPNHKIYFKLHPSQFLDFSMNELFFLNFKNIEVIAFQKNVKNLIEISDEFIAIYSTAVFEILQSGKIIYLFKRQNYACFEKYFDLDNVYLFDSAVELIELRKRSFILYSDRNLPQFFKKFNHSKFSETISL